MPQTDTKKIFKAGEIIMKQGDDGDCAFIIEDGLVEIEIEKEGQEPIVVGTRGKNAMIGEMALVDNAPRTATIRALKDCKMLEITKDDFSKRLKDADPILRMTIQVILTRYRDTLTRADISKENNNWPPAEQVEQGYSDHSDAIDIVRIANEFQSALNNDETTLYYQPIVNMTDGSIAGFEALMRWENAEQGFISPAVFIPIVEETGLILKASQWALKESCAALKRIEKETKFKHKLFMSVNFTSDDFTSEDFMGSVYEAISVTDLRPEQVHIEITERILMDQPDSARETLEMCQKAGMSIAIDDFGTGYSSLSYLHYFPIDTLKIDRSFVVDMQKNDTSMALIQSIVALCKNMNMKIIAEGIETKEEAHILRDLGCEMAQGFYFAKPMPEEEVIDFSIKNKTINF